MTDIERLILDRKPVKCDKCFCADCARELSNGIQKVFYNEIGEKPKYDYAMKGKMHFLNRK